jgi:AraC family transcriptional regulator
LGQHARVPDSITDYRGGLVGTLLCRLYCEYQARDAAAPLAMEGLTLEVLAEISPARLCPTDPRPPRWLLQARDLLHDQFASNVTLSDIAAAVDIHPTYLARAFRRQFGCSLGDELRRLRVEFACRKLADADLPLNLVALDAGFADQSHFSKVFKRHMGMTPAQFKNSRPGREK